MSWNQWELSGQSSCALGLQAGNDQFEAGLWLTFFTYVKKSNKCTYEKVKHRLASNRWFPACKPRAQPFRPDDSHRFQDIVSYLFQPTSSLVQPAYHPAERISMTIYSKLVLLTYTTTILNLLTRDEVWNSCVGRASISHEHCEILYFHYTWQCNKYHRRKMSIFTWIYLRSCNSSV